MRIRNFVMLMPLSFLLSCSVRTYVETLDHSTVNYETTIPQKIQIYSTDNIPHEYVVLGLVSSVGVDAKSSVSALKHVAAKLGADGIIDLRLGIMITDDLDPVTSKGKAVKYLK